MRNIGLKTYSQNLTRELSCGNAHINLCPAETNVILTIPLIEEMGINYVYNYLSRDEKGTISSGGHISLFRRLDTNTNKILNPDYSVDEYVLGEENEETGLTLKKTSDDHYGLTNKYTLEDKSGNSIIYRGPFYDYPSEIVNSNNTRTIISQSSGKMVVANGNYSAEITLANDGSVEEIKYMHKRKGEANPVVLKTVVINNLEDVLLSLEFRSARGGMTSVDLEFDDDIITVTDTFEGTGERYVFENSRIKEIYSFGHGKNEKEAEFSFDDTNNVTTVTNSFNKKEYYFFEKRVVKNKEYYFNSLCMNDNGDASSTHINDDMSPAYDFGYDKYMLSNAIIKGQSVDIDDGNCGVYQNKTELERILFDRIDICNPLKMDWDFNVFAVGTDTLTFSCFAKAINGTCEIKVKLNRTEETIKLSNNWKLLCVKLDVTETIEKITIKLDSTGPVLITPFNVFKNNFANVYKYNENDQTVSDGNSNFGYTGDMITSLTSGSGTKYNFKYNDDKELISFKGPHGVVATQDYTDHKVTRKTVKSKYWDLDSYVVYQNDLVAQERDSLSCVDYEYDAFDEIKRISTAASCIDITSRDVYGNVLESIVEGKGEYEGKSAKAVYSYNNRRKLEYITLDNGAKYKFDYDNNLRLRFVLLNGVCVFRYDYNDDGMISRQYFGASSDYFEFEYNEKKQVQRLYYSSGDLFYEYSYDDDDRLIEIRENRGGVYKTIEAYAFDSNGSLVKTYNQVKELTKVYDANGSEIRNVSKFNGKEIIQEYDTVERSKASCPESIIGELSESKGYSVAAFIDTYNCIGVNKTYSCSTLSEHIPSKPIRHFNVQSISYEDKIMYSLERNWEPGAINETIAFWFYSSKLHSNHCLFKMNGSESNAGIAIYERDGNHFEVVQFDEKGTENVLIVTDSKMHTKTEEWNFISLTVFYDHNPSDAYCILRVNSKVYEDNGRWLNRSSVINGDVQIRFGYNLKGSMDACELVDVFDRGFYTLITIWDACEGDSSDPSFYNKTKDYFMDNAVFDYINVDYSIANLIKSNNANYGSFKIFPLDNSLFSLDYNPLNENEYDSPYQLDVRYGLRNDKDKLFNFNKFLKRYAFVLDGNKLSYKVNLGQSGTIAAVYYFDSVNEKQYLFDAKGDETRIGLYRNENKKLVIRCNNTTRETNMLVENGWHTIALSYDTSILSDSNATQSRCTVRLKDLTTDLEAIENIYDASNIRLSEIMLGRSFDYDMDIGERKTYHPLYGQIANFAYNGAYNTVETIKNLYSNISTITKIQMYDELGYVREETIEKNSSKIYNKTVDYRNVGPQISSESFDGQNFRLDRHYSFDDAGNLVGVTCEGDQNYECSYKYDFRGFLVEETDTRPDWTISYEYDGNGNIKTRTHGPRYEVCGYGYPQPTRPTSDRPVQTDTFIYDRNVPDKLISFNGIEIKYDSKAPGNISSFGNWNYEYQGRRLVKAFRDDSSYDPFVGKIIDKESVEFEYNDKGLRTLKKHTLLRQLVTGRILQSEETITRYEYDDENLVYEKSNDNEVFYLYDESKNLYGYILNNNKYFYVRDALDNILGVVDENGTIVAKYVHDAYGNLISSEGTIYNPIRYKSYYYDSELNMYYCKSRFYVPQLCRWLNMDNPNFLELTDATRLNLFAYCYNNPVMFSDPNGNLPWWAKILIGVAVIAVLAVATYCTGGAAAGAVGFVLAGALKGAIVGAAIGTAVGAAVGGISAAINHENVWEGIFNGAVDGFMSGAITGAITGAISSGAQLHHASKLWTTTNGRSGFKEMINHYQKHVVQQGKKGIAKNIVKYSKDAASFFKNNAASGTLVREGVLRVGQHGALGGYFDVTGLIRTFWYM